MEEPATGDPRCSVHGSVAALQRFEPPTLEHARVYSAHSRLPVWMPWPLPADWFVSGIGHAGQTLTGARASVLACSGPNPLGGAADMLVVTEEPGVGLGARYAGLPAPDPGAEFGQGVADSKPFVDGHPTPMWVVRGAADDRAVYAGEADGRWLWIILHPDTAGALMMEPLNLVDIRDLGREFDLVPLGPLCRRLLD